MPSVIGRWEQRADIFLSLIQRRLNNLSTWTLSCLWSMSFLSKQAFQLRDTELKILEIKPSSAEGSKQFKSNWNVLGREPMNRRKLLWFCLWVAWNCYLVIFKKNHSKCLTQMGVAIHFIKVQKHFNFHFSQTESFTSGGHLVHTTLECKHNHLRIRILEEDFVVSVV